MFMDITVDTTMPLVSTGTIPLPDVSTNRTWSHHPPRIIHQIWFDFGTMFSSEHHRMVERNRRMATDDGFEYILWTLSSALDFIVKHYPYFQSFFTKKLPYNIVKCDFFRYLVLYHYGGLYMDLDFYILEPFDRLYSRVFGLDSRSKQTTTSPMSSGNAPFAPDIERVCGYEVYQGSDGNSLARSSLRPIPAFASVILSEEWYESVKYHPNECCTTSVDGTLHNGFLISRPMVAFWMEIVCDIYANHLDVLEKNDVWRVSGTNKLRNAYFTFCRQNAYKHDDASICSPSIFYLPYYYICPYKCVPHRTDYPPYLCKSPENPPLSLTDSYWVFLSLSEIENDVVKNELSKSIAASIILENGSLWMNKDIKDH
jgi:hypothetical protein